MSTYTTLCNMHSVTCKSATTATACWDLDASKAGSRCEREKERASGPDLGQVT